MRAELADAIEGSGFSELAVRIGHTARVRSLPLHHRDPFDRILMAQALEEGMTLVSRDPVFTRYSVPALWS
jgi:PIN domain nuclease of toxin-antitoxin system